MSVQMAIELREKRGVQPVLQAIVFPAVELNIPPDRRVEGLVLWVAVDLEAKKVVKIHST